MSISSVWQRISPAKLRAGLLGRAFLVNIALLLVSARAEDWPGWRGPRGDGTSTARGVPVRWSATENLRWKTELPGEGYASPIVWGERIFIVAADPVNQARTLLCLDRLSGRILWKRTVLVAPLERKHGLNSYASSTPATDGARVIVSFLDQDQMWAAAYDFEGNLQWQSRPGPFSSMHGFCSSPVLFEGRVILNGDHDGDSYLVALDLQNGKTLWKTPRHNRTRSYGVPLIRELSGRTQMILSGDKSIASYDPRQGRLHWILDGPTDQFVASVVYDPGADLLFITGGYPDLHILGLRHDGRGQIDESQVAWRSNKGVSYVPSPVAVGGYFFVVSDGGIATCFEARTGKIQWQERLGGGHHASLVTAEDRIYFLSDDGICTVVAAAPEFQIISKNDLGEKCFASPAVAGRQMLIRSHRHLFSIEGAAPPGSTGAD